MSSKTNPGKLIVFSAPSGSGKTTIVRYLLAQEELNLEFSSKKLAVEYAKKNKIDFEIIEPQKRKTIKKSYADNFLK